MDDLFSQVLLTRQFQKISRNFTVRVEPQIEKFFETQLFAHFIEIVFSVAF